MRSERSHAMDRIVIDVSGAIQGGLCSKTYESGKS